MQVFVDCFKFVFLGVELFQGEMWELGGVLVGILFEETILVSQHVDWVRRVLVWLHFGCHGAQEVAASFVSSEWVEASIALSAIQISLLPKEPESRLKGLEVLLIFANFRTELMLLPDLVFNLLAMRVIRSSTCALSSLINNLGSLVLISTHHFDAVFVVDKAEHVGLLRLSAVEVNLLLLFSLLGTLRRLTFRLELLNAGEGVVLGL